jgi:hypothetical protein
VIASRPSSAAGAGAGRCSPSGAPDLLGRALDVPNDSLSAVVDVDVLNAHELRAAIPEPAERLNLSGKCLQ